MSFLHEIRKQPRHHREIMFGLCVVTTISMVGMVWYNSFEKNLYALLNPGETTDQRNLAENKDVPSLLGNISDTAKDLKASFYSIFNLTNGDKKDLPAGQAGNVENDKKTDSGKVYMLPLSGKK